VQVAAAYRDDAVLTLEGNNLFFVTKKLIFFKSLSVKKIYSQVNDRVGLRESYSTYHFCTLTVLSLDVNQVLNAYRKK
jgi:hypothetical protein